MPNFCASLAKQSTAEDENQQLLFNHINEQIVKHAQVVEENERLEAELQHRVESAAPSTHPGDAASASTPDSEQKHRELTDRYDDLSKRYQDLSQKVKYLERKNTAVMQKNRDMKDSVRAWQQYADRQKPLLKLKGARAEEGPSKTSAIPQSDDVPPQMLSSPRSVSSMPTPYQRAQQGYASPAPGHLPVDIDTGDEVALPEAHLRSSSEATTPKGPTAVSSIEYQVAAHSDVPLEVRLDRTRRYHVEANGAPSSSQTTVDEAPDQLNRRTQAVHMDDEDDVPQIVSERSLKRKRSQQSKIEVYTGRSSDGTPAKPHCVKDEPLSSPPSAVYALMRTETIDLDDPAANVPEAARPLQSTPSMHSNTTGTIRHQRSGSAPFSQVTHQGTTQLEQRAKNRMSDVQARLEIAAAEMRALSEPSNLRFDEHILQQLDPNVVAQSPERTPNKRLKQAITRQLEHEAIAESGEMLPPMNENELRLPPSAARARLQKLRAVKDPQTPVARLQYHPTSGSPLVKHEQIPSPPTSISRSSLGSNVSRQTASNARSNPQEDIVPDSRPIWSMRASEKRSVQQSRNTSPSDKQSRLRRKPVKELRVHDFKPNPAYNQGYSYAFSEAVRKRGDRMCLPGCTNPQCCGSHFRRLAEALDPLPATQEETLLEEYLGDAYSTVVSTQMSSNERGELVLQARTKKMAKDSGKHREAYERRRTPPGFWRVDFPTTQEQEDDRGRAKEQEIKAVQERWLEAQKKGGRWIFRDE